MSWFPASGYEKAPGRLILEKYYEKNAELKYTDFKMFLTGNRGKYLFLQRGMLITRSVRFPVAKSQDIQLINS